MFAGSRLRPLPRPDAAALDQISASRENGVESGSFERSVKDNPCCQIRRLIPSCRVKSNKAGVSHGGARQAGSDQERSRARQHGSIWRFGSHDRSWTAAYAGDETLVWQGEQRAWISLVAP